MLPARIVPGIGCERVSTARTPKGAPKGEPAGVLCGVPDTATSDMPAPAENSLVSFVVRLLAVEVTTSPAGMAGTVAVNAAKPLASVFTLSSPSSVRPWTVALGGVEKNCSRKAVLGVQLS